MRNFFSTKVFLGSVFLVCLAFESFAQINCPPNLPLTLIGNTEYCVGTPGSELAVQESYDLYEWLPTSETSQNVLLTAGNYELVVTHYTGCTDTLSFEVQQVSNPPQPTVTANGPTEFCYGESVTLSGPSGYPYYEWNTGSVSETITVHENGTFVLSVEDWLGCVSSSNAITVVVNPLPTAIFSPYVNGFDLELNNLSVNATSFEWNFGDGNVSTEFEPTHAYAVGGLLDMYLVAENDCGTDTAFLNLTSVSVTEIDSFAQVKLYPNPSTGIFEYTLNGSMVSNEVRINVLGLSGLRVKTVAENPLGTGNKNVLDLSDLNPGNYLVEFQSDGYKAIQKVVLISY